jgi:antitoxin VapB
MGDTAVAKILTHGRSQAVRLPLAFRMPGDRVRVRRAGRCVVLEPIGADLDAWFAELDRFADIPFMEDGRRAALARWRRIRGRFRHGTVQIGDPSLISL